MRNVLVGLLGALVFVLPVHAQQPDTLKPPDLRHTCSNNRSGVEVCTFEPYSDQCLLVYEFGEGLRLESVWRSDPRSEGCFTTPPGPPPTPDPDPDPDPQPEVEDPRFNGMIVFQDDFEFGPSSGWADIGSPGQQSIVPLGDGHVLEARYRGGTEGAGWRTVFFMPGYSDIYVRYRVRLEEGWEEATKLGLLYGSHLDNQWSGFGQAGTCPNGVDYFQTGAITFDGDPGRTSFYSYWPDMNREPDGVTCWGRLGPNTGHTLTTGEWHTIENRVRLNDPGSENALQQIWVDGELVGEWGGIRFRNIDELRLNAFQLPFHQATGTPRDQVMYVDDVLVMALDEEDPDPDPSPDPTPDPDPEPDPMPDPDPSDPFPNQPAGFTPITENPFNALAAGEWGHRNRTSRSRIVQDASAPFSPSNVLEHFFPSGFPGSGTEPAVDWVYLNGANDIYVSFYWQPSNPWDGHGSWINKVLFLWNVGFDDSDDELETGQVLFTMRGPRGGPWHLEAVVGGAPDPRTTYLAQNVQQVPVRLGEWHHVEIVIRNGPNGSIRWWQDGSLVGDYSPYNLFSLGFGFMQVAPTWGGVGSERKRQDDYFRYDHIYVSGSGGGRP